jgi:hypothetical protein
MSQIIEPLPPVKMTVITPEPDDRFINHSGAKALDVHPRPRKGGKVKSSINKARIDILPEVYHRPLTGSGVYSGNFTDKGKPKKAKIQRDFEHQEIFTRKDYDNPNVNLLRAFEPVFSPMETSIFLASKLVTAVNHPHRKNASEVEYLTNQYRSILEECNICYKCRKPIKVQSEAINAPVFKKHKRRNGLNIEEHFQPARPINNVMFADVASHCEIYTKSDGKLGFLIVSEAGEPKERAWIELRYNGPAKYQGRYFVEINKSNRKEVELDFVPSSYRVLGKKCTCMFRQAGKTVTVKS